MYLGISCRTLTEHRPEVRASRDITPLIGFDREAKCRSDAVREGVEKAAEVGLDLVEVAPNAEPPVCKLIDYGKFKYVQSKKQNEAKKKQKVIEVKEIKLRPNIDIHDYNVKLRAAQKFLGGGDKVKVTLRFRGREMAHQDLGLGMLQRFSGDLEDLSKPEMMPKMEGRVMIMVLAPR